MWEFVTTHWDLLAEALLALIPIILLTKWGLGKREALLFLARMIEASKKVRVIDEKGAEKRATVEDAVAAIKASAPKRLKPSANDALLAVVDIVDDKKTPKSAAKRLGMLAFRAALGALSRKRG